MKTTIYGAAGLLGESLVRHFTEAGWQVRACTRKEVDLADLDALREDLRANPTDLMLNAAGMTGLEGCVDFPDEAHRVNVLAPSEMARACSCEKIPFVHFSTDYVFDADSPGFLLESDATMPANIYGRTKLDGEREVLNKNPASLVCRVSWLFGHGRRSFVDQVVDSARAGSPQAYISDKWSVPNFADDLAEMCFELIEKQAKGIVHLCSRGGEATWYSYAKAVLEVMRELEMLESSDGLLLESKLDEVTAFRAKRPRFTSMISGRLHSEFGIEPPHWKHGLKRFLANQA